MSSPRGACQSSGVLHALSGPCPLAPPCAASPQHSAPGGDAHFPCSALLACRACDDLPPLQGLHLLAHTCRLGPVGLPAWRSPSTRLVGNMLKVKQPQTMTCEPQTAWGACRHAQPQHRAGGQHAGSGTQAWTVACWPWTWDSAWWICRHAQPQHWAGGQHAGRGRAQLGAQRQLRRGGHRLLLRVSAQGGGFGLTGEPAVVQPDDTGACPAATAPSGLTWPFLVRVHAQRGHLGYEGTAAVQTREGACPQRTGPSLLG